MSTTTQLSLDQKQRRAFLKLLDRGVSRFNFRVLDDKKQGDASRKLDGHIDDLEDDLQRHNTSGAGIFVVVNEGGHRDADITRVRAVFADTDGAPQQPIVDALKPHCVIETSLGKFHVYWLVDDSFPLDQFKPVQQAIAARFGTDTSVCNLSRVMRVPGFAHNKFEPFPVSFVDIAQGLPRYGLDDIVGGLGLSLSTTSTPVIDVGARQYRPSLLHAMYSNPYSLIDVRQMLRRVDPGCSRDQWMKVLFILASEYGEEARSLVDEWSRGDLWEGAENAPE